MHQAWDQSDFGACTADEGMQKNFANENVILELFEESTNSATDIGKGVRDPVTTLVLENFRTVTLTHQLFFVVT